MALVDETDWWAGDASLAEIVVSFDNVATLGRISLTSVRPSDLSPASPYDHVGEARFRVTPAADIRFTLHVFCEHAVASTGLYLKITQGRPLRVLKCTDDGGTTLNGSPGRYRALKVDDLSQGDDVILHFDLLLPAQGA